MLPVSFLSDQVTDMDVTYTSPALGVFLCLCISLEVQRCLELTNLFAKEMLKALLPLL